MSLIKSTVTEITFMESVSDGSDMRVLKLRLDGEGAGRFLTLSNDRGAEIYITPNDLDELAKTAHQLWSQGDVYYPGEAGEDVDEPPLNRSEILKTPREMVTVLGKRVDALETLNKLSMDVANRQTALEQIRYLNGEAFKQVCKASDDTGTAKAILKRIEEILDSVDAASL